MPYYRLYHLDPHTGHINRADEIHAADDAAAMRELQQRHCAHPLELWERGRKVGWSHAVPDAAAFTRAAAG